MRLNHRKICDTIAKEFNLDYYKRGKFFYFTKDIGNGYIKEVWFIEHIPAGKYLKTIYVKFFDMWGIEQEEWNNKIEYRILELYKQQRKWQPVDWCFSCQKFYELF